MCSKGWKSIPRDLTKVFRAPVLKPSITAVAGSTSINIAFTSPLGDTRLLIIPPDGDTEQLDGPAAGISHFQPHVEGLHYVNLLDKATGRKLGQAVFDPSWVTGWVPGPQPKYHD